MSNWLAATAVKMVSKSARTFGVPPSMVWKVGPPGDAPSVGASSRHAAATRSTVVTTASRAHKLPLRTFPPPSSFPLSRETGANASSLGPANSTGGGELRQPPADPRSELEPVAAAGRPDHHRAPPLQDEMLVGRVRVDAGLGVVGLPLGLRE